MAKEDIYIVSAADGQEYLHGCFGPNDRSASPYNEAKPANTGRYVEREQVSL